MTTPTDAPASTSKAGRNLPAAAAVGVLLASVAVGSLFIDKRWFLVLAAAAMLTAVWELGGALRTADIHLPTVPLYAGVLGTIAGGWFAGAGGVAIGMALSVLAVLMWRGVRGPQGYVTDVSSGAFTVGYLLMAGGFATLLVREDDGPFRVLAWLLLVVASDVGGYAMGVMFGKTPMAPSVSPKKSWEGFSGSVLACVTLGTIVVMWALDGEWWAGVILGVAMAMAATLGDLAESLLKRDIGVKDMGSLLPGHGGVMDRLDSIALSAPIAWLVLTYLVPVA
jgi:phosphatidate cytidylyltransferase